jgi:hypothetical protein
MDWYWIALHCLWSCGVIVCVWEITTVTRYTVLLHGLRNEIGTLREELNAIKRREVGTMMMRLRLLEHRMYVPDPQGQEE